MNCDCLKTINTKIKPHGVEVSNSMKSVTVAMELKLAIPLQKAGGGKLSKRDPAYIEAAHCPFCGKSTQVENPISK